MQSFRSWVRKVQVVGALLQGWLGVQGRLHGTRGTPGSPGPAGCPKSYCQSSKVNIVTIPKKKKMSNQLGRRATRASLGEVGALPGRCRLLQCGVTQPRPQSATSFSQIWQHWQRYLCWLLHQFNSIRSIGSRSVISH